MRISLVFVDFEAVQWEAELVGQTRQRLRPLEKVEAVEAGLGLGVVIVVVVEKGSVQSWLEIFQYLRFVVRQLWRPGASPPTPTTLTPRLLLLPHHHLQPRRPLRPALPRSPAMMPAAGFVLGKQLNRPKCRRAYRLVLLRGAARPRT